MNFCPSCGSKLENAIEQSILEENANVSNPVNTAQVTLLEHCGCSMAKQLVAGTSFVGQDEICNKCGKPRAERSTEEKGFAVFMGFIGIALVILIILFVAIGVNSSQDQARLEANERTVEGIVEGCISQLQRVNQGVSDASNLRVQGIRSILQSPVEFDPIVDGQILGDVSCDFSLNRTANTFSIEQISWEFLDKGIEKTATVIPGEPVIVAEGNPRSIPNNQPDVDRSGPSCLEAFREAAAVPLSQTNDLEVEATLYACESVSEWWSAAKQYPNAFGASSYPDSDLGIYISVACFENDSSPVCREATDQGLR